MLNSSFYFIHFYTRLLIVLPITGITFLMLILPTLLFLSFLVAGSEVAFFSLSAKEINLLKTKKKPSYKRIIELLDQPQRLLTSMLIAKSFINILFILIANRLLDNWISPIHPYAMFILLKLLIVSFAIVLFAEILPKVWASHHKVWFASNASVIINYSYHFFFNLSHILVSLTNRLEKRELLINHKERGNRNLDNVIDLLSESEASKEEKKILKGIRKFGNTSVKQVMRTRLDVSGIAHNLTMKEVIALTEDLHYSRLPVYKGNLDNIVGILHVKDVLPFLEQEDSFDWKTLLRPPYFVHEKKPIEDLLQEFRTKRIHFAVVVDEFGGTEGIVTLEDIIEEIIGEIKDEFDDEELTNRKIDHNTWVFEGKTMINDFCKLLQIEDDYFEHVRGDSDSLAGLVLEIAGEFPQLNDHFHFGTFTFIPTAINKNRIDQVKVIIDFLKDSQQ